MDVSQALATLRVETANYRAAEKQMDSARAGVERAIVAALQAGARPTDVADASPFTATYARKIARENGIAPARPVA